MGDQRVAAQGLVRHEVAFLLAGARSADPARRAEAVAGLRSCARRGRSWAPAQVAEALLGAVGDPEAVVRLRAVSAMPSLPGAVGFSAAAAALDDADHVVREAAGHALVAIDGTRAELLLAACCRDGDRSPSGGCLDGDPCPCRYRPTDLDRPDRGPGRP